MNNSINKLITSIMVSTKNQQMTEEEYKYISTFLGNKNFLIFGTGFDSELWRYSNKDGVTLFLEHNDQWILNSNDTYKVKYTTHKKRDSQRLLELYKQNITNELNIDLPDIVLNTNWDIILVDSPEGGKNCHPGRMQSIYAAKHLSKLGTEIFIHDCDREVEDIYSKTMFNNLIKQLTKLRHYRV